MKKALVWKEAHAGRVVGQIERIGEASEIDSWTSYLKEKMETVEVPVGLESKESHELKTVLIAEVPAVDEVLEDIDNGISYVAPVDAIPAHYEVILDTAVDQLSRISDLYSALTKDIYDQLEATFGTRAPETATADEKTYQMMSETPSDYSAIGIVAKFATGSLSIGDVLDTDAKILEYATSKISDIKAYGVYRMTRKLQFDNDKATILAE